MSHGWLGFLIFPLIAFLFSIQRKAVDLKFCFLALLMQLVFALLIHKVPYIQQGFLSVSEGVNHLKTATTEGTKFVFGYLGGQDSPFQVQNPSKLFIFAFQALPMIIVISALSMVLFYWKILPFLVKGFSWALRRSLNIGGALGLCASAKVFLGQTDAPLLIRPYLSKLTRSELFSVMTAGMATTSASAMPIYASLLEGQVAHPLSHILAASFISIPAALLMSRLMIPEEQDKTEGDLADPYPFSSTMDAIARGTQDGLSLYLSLIAVLIVALAIVKLMNMILGCLPDLGGEAISLERCAGLLMAPITWLMGVPWAEASRAGELLGTKIILNEIIAFIQFPKDPALSPASKIIMIYGLCGFANLSSIGIQIAGLGTLAPTRRLDIIALAPKALLAGTLASCLSGSMVGFIMSF